MSEQGTQFWYMETGNFHDDFIFLIEWDHFFTKMHKFSDNFTAWTRYTIFVRGIFCIFQVPNKKINSTNWHSTLSLAGNKNLKIAKNQLKNSVMAVKYSFWKAEGHTNTAFKMQISFRHGLSWRSMFLVKKNLLFTWALRFGSTLKIMWS